LASTYSMESLDGMVAAAATRGVTLSNVLSYRALAQALIDPERYTGDLVQANFMNYDPTCAFDLSAYESPEALTTRRHSRMPINEWLEYRELPRYFLAALADRQEGETQVAIIALVYFNA